MIQSRKISETPPEKDIGGVEVDDMESNPLFVRVAASGLRLAEVTPQSLDAMRDILAFWLTEGWLDGVCLKRFKRESIDFLVDYPNLKAISLRDCVAVSLPDLGRFPRLTSLEMSDEGRSKVLDLSAAPKLRGFYGTWGRGLVGFNGLLDLAVLRLRGAKMRDLTELHLPASVTDLQLIQGMFEKMSSWKNLENVTHMRLCGLSNLVSLGEMSDLGLIQSLEMENLKKVEDFSTLGKCKNLRRLNVLGCGSIASFGWIESLSLLEHLGVFRTSIVDGDLSPVLKLRKLVSFGCDNKKHYHPSLRSIEVAISKNQQFCISNGFV